MKKIKLIAPILGAAATLGTAIPLAACQEQGTAVEVTVEKDSSAEGFVEVTSALPKCSEGKDFNATVTWKHYTTEAKEEEYFATYLTKFEIYDASGEKEVLITPAEENYTLDFSYGQFTYHLDGKYVTSKMSIKFEVKNVRDFNASVSEGWEGATRDQKVIHGYGLTSGRYVDVAGIRSAALPSDWTSEIRTIEFIFPLTTIIDNLGKLGITDLANETSLHLYFEDANGNRSNPTGCGGVKLLFAGDKTKNIEISGSFSDTYYALTMPTKGKITKEVIANADKYTLVGYYTYGILSGEDLRGGRICLYPHSEVVGR